MLAIAACGAAHSRQQASPSLTGPHSVPHDVFCNAICLNHAWYLR